jgi:hypothetical protein
VSYVLLSSVRTPARWHLGPFPTLEAAEEWVAAFNAPPRPDTYSADSAEAEAAGALPLELVAEVDR